MIEKINEIRQSLKHDCLLSALALSLTLPDICGQVAYPSEKGVGKRYKDWFDTYIFNPTKEKDNCFLNFDGAKCYSLRCAYLHSGNTDLKKIYSFNLAKCYIEDPRTKEMKSIQRINLFTGNESNPDIIQNQDISSLCNVICDAAEKYYNQVGNKSAFIDHSIKIQTFIVKEEGKANGK